MLRKISLACLCSLVSTSSLVNAAPYVGAGIGPEFGDFGQENHVSSPGAFDVENKVHLSGLGVLGSLFAGYDWNFGKFNFAGEVNADINSIEAQTSNAEYIHHTFTDSNYKITPTFGISFLPGYFFSDNTLVYARLGYSNTYFQLTTSDASLTDASEHVNGFRFGVGLKKALFNNISIRMEYSQVRYQSISFGTVDNVSRVTDASSIRPQTGQVEFGLIYNFT
jgi:outer membrane immunogenic protein